jgi:hypothetical protein
MAEKMRRRPYEGDAYQEIRKAGFWGFWKPSREIVGPDGELVYIPTAAIARTMKGRSPSCSAGAVPI